MGYSCEIVADSVNTLGNRITPVDWVAPIPVITITLPTSFAENDPPEIVIVLFVVLAVTEKVDC